MEFRLFVALLILAGILLPSGAAQSFNAYENTPAPIATIRRTVDEVSVAFTVTDKKGRFISNLNSADFQLLDNHRSPEKLTFFQQRSDLPLHVGILIDASASVQDRFKFEQYAAVAFVKKMLRPGTDRAFILAFNDKVMTIHDVTNRTEKLARSLHKAKPGGNTALNDAIISATEKLRQIPQDQLTRRAIILISDGVDTVNRSTLEEAEQAAARADAMIFALNTNYANTLAPEEGDSVLKELAESTGGSLLKAHQDDQLTSAFHNVEKALRNQYVVAYNPAEFQADGTFRTVQVIPRKNGLKTTCRKGYYARVRTLQ